MNLQITNAPIVTSRGILRDIAISPYDVSDTGEGLKLVCQKFQGLIFIQDFPTQARIDRDSKVSGDDSKQMLHEYGGHKLEQLVSSEKPGVSF